MACDPNAKCADHDHDHDHDHDADSTKTVDDTEQFARALESLTAVLDTEFARSLVSIASEAIRRRCSLDAQAAERHEKVLAAQVQVANRWAWVFTGCVLFSFAFLAGVVWMLKDNSDALLPVVTALVGLIAGTGGGWVFGQRATKIHE